MNTNLTSSLVDLFTRGGPVIALLLVLSIFALTIIIAKTLQFMTLRLNAGALVSKAMSSWQQGDMTGAYKLLQPKQRQPVARVTAVAMRELLQGATEYAAREETTRVAKVQIEGLRSWLRPLDTVATISPLLGLFGTVLGMIEAFQRLELAGSNVDPAILSGGIWQALLTTAAGLAVAIPATLAHAWLERKVERSAHAMENTATRVFTLWRGPNSGQASTR